MSAPMGSVTWVIVRFTTAIPPGAMFCTGGATLRMGAADALEGPQATASSTKSAHTSLRFMTVIKE